MHPPPPPLPRSYAYVYKSAIILNLLHVGGSKPVSRNVSRLNMHQLSTLEKSFGVTCYPNNPTMMKLDLKTGLHKAQIHRWFENERQSTRGGKCRGTLSF